MNEMTPAERVALDALRATAVAKMSDADFANLETEVALKGLRNLDGWFGAQVAKAVEQVLKHPGHANQASHGGGKGGDGGSKDQSSRVAVGISEATESTSSASNLNGKITERLDMTLSGATRAQAVGQMTQSGMALDRAKSSLKRADAMHGVDGGSRDKHLQETKRQLLSSKKSVEAVFNTIEPTGTTYDALEKLSSRIDSALSQVNSALK